MCTQGGVQGPGSALLYPACTTPPGYTAVLHAAPGLITAPRGCSGRRVLGSDPLLSLGKNLLEDYPAQSGHDS